MFNKNILLAAGLLFSTVATILPVGEQEREIIYTIHELGQDFAQIPMVVQNIDAFIGIFQMNIEMTEAKLAIAAQKAKKSLINNVAAIAAVGIARAGLYIGMCWARDAVSWETKKAIFDRGIHALIETPCSFLMGATYFYYALNIHDAYKAKNALAETLALDKEILEKLIEIKELLVESPVEAEIAN